MFAERESQAVYFLQEQDMTRFHAVNNISHGIPKGPMGPDPTGAPHTQAGGTGWRTRRPVQYVKGRLAFMKAELEISDAQEQLWKVFAEALRDFLKSGSRLGIGGQAGITTLPERLAMRERDLVSDLEELRQWKAIVETFYAGLSDEQRRGADQLLTHLFGLYRDERITQNDIP